MKSFAPTVNTAAASIIVLGVNGVANDPDAITIMADPANGAGVVYIGGPDVSTANGYPLVVAGPSLSFDAVSTEDVWAVASTNGLKLRCIKKFLS